MLTIGQNCHNILSVYPIYRLSEYHDQIGVFLFVIAIIYLVNSFIILYWIKKQEDAAKLGDHKAVKSVIFPVFVDVMWLNAVSNSCVYYLKHLALSNRLLTFMLE